MRMAPPPAVVVPEPKTKVSLVLAGVLLIVLFVVGIVLARLIGSESEEVTTPTGPGSTTTEITKSTTTKAWPSDTLLTAVLATGAVLIVVGLLFARMSAIKFPGGAEITLTQAEKEKAAQKVQEKLDEGQIQPDKAAQVTVVALEELALTKQAAMTSAVAASPQLPDVKVEEAVNTAIQTAGAAPPP
jgi:hypothetical protein